MYTNNLIYVINMSQEKDRWASAQSQAIELGLNLNRVVAIDAKDVPVEECNFVTPGVRAIWMSHVKVMRLFLESNLSHLIIAEDDFHIESPKQLISVLQRTDILEYDVVQLGWLTPGFDNRLKKTYSNAEHTLFRFIYYVLIRLKPKSSTLKRLRVKNSGSCPKGFVPDDFQPGTHFYLISRKFAQTILKLNEPQFLAADDFCMALAKMRSLKFIRTKSSLVSQRFFGNWLGSRFINH